MYTRCREPLSETISVKAGYNVFEKSFRTEGEKVLSTQMKISTKEEELKNFNCFLVLLMKVQKLDKREQKKKKLE